MYKIVFSNSAIKIAAKWEKSNPSAFKKLEKIKAELEVHPRTGTGHPEPLVSGNLICYSRHITAHDRIIYEIYEDILIVSIVDIEGHYNDK